MTKIIADPNIMLGKPTIAGTRITVEQILRLLAQKLTIKDIHKDFPQLKEIDIKTAVEYAAKAVAIPKREAKPLLHEVHRG
ncbi:MAG: DUF433 domain-containing protein [Candidatus Levybacteria bacterium]|nr:DUF433 domain-containing protein [Candidatus Levybacteria bacterium]